LPHPHKNHQNSGGVKVANRQKSRHKKTRQVEKLKQALPALAVFLGARKLIFKSAPGGCPPLYYPRTLRLCPAGVNTGQGSA